jgi:TctA family transporter
MAVLLGAFIIAGLDPGPEMLSTNLDITFSMVWIFVISNIIAVLVALLLLRQLVKLTFVKGTWLVPFLLILLSIGAFTANNAWQDVVVMLVAAAVGVICIHWDWPRVPFLLAVVLGGIAERYLFLSYSLDGWTWLNDPIVLGLMAVIVLVTVGPVVTSARKRRAAARTERNDRAEVTP